MKCIQCGRVVAEEKAVLCNDCFRTKHTCFKSFESHTLLICAPCGSYKYQKQWKLRKPKNEALQESVLNNCDFLIQPEAIELKITLADEHGKVQNGKAILRTETKIEQQTFVEEFELPVKIKYSICDQCAKLKTEYFEGILQLRGENKEMLEKAHEFVLNDASYANKKRVFITKIEEMKTGIDYYYTKQQYLPVIMKKLVKKFKAAGKTHAELFSRSRQTSKDLYRVNASVRLPL